MKIKAASVWQSFGVIAAITAVSGAPIHAQSPSASLVWTYSSGPESWVPRVVTVGDQGSNVFTNLDGWGGAPRMFSSNDQNPPTPVWTGTGPYIATNARVDSSKDAGVYAEMHFAQTSSTAPKSPVLNKYGANASAPQWTYTFPFTVSSGSNGVHVSRDGRTIVGWVFDWSTQKTNVAVFDSTSNQPRSYTAVDTAGEPRSTVLSSDGNTLLVVAQLRTVVFDARNATTAYTGTNWSGIGPGHALSGDGSVFAKSLPDRRVEVWRRQGASYALDFTHEAPPLTQCGRMAISEDGSTLAMAFASMDNFLNVRVRVLDLTSTQHAILLDDTINGAGSYSNVASDVAVSSDGSKLAVGLTGDQAGQAPEVLAYARSGAAYTRILAQDLPGSVNDIDLSADGRRLAVASKATHNIVGTGGGRIDLFDLEAPPAISHGDLTLQGVAHAGGTVNVTQYIAPGTPALLLRAPAAAAVPQLFPGVGTLYLQRATMQAVDSGSANASGMLTSVVTVPASPGTTYYFQGFSTTPRKLSTDWVQMTVVP